MCLTDGQLQAYLDGELPADERDDAAGHIGRCERCRERAAASERRRTQVADLLATLAPTQAPMPASVALAQFRADRAAAPVRAFNVGLAFRTALAAAALCAVGFVVGIALRPSTPDKASVRVERPAPTTAPPVISAAPSVASNVVEPEVIAPPRPRAVTQTRPRSRPTRGNNTYFLLTEDGTLPEMGMVVRTRIPLSMLGNAGPDIDVRAGGDIQADVLVGQDGRPRAIRFVSDTKPAGRR